MATTKCPRCKIGVNANRDKSLTRWRWSVNHYTYVCKACESELLAKHKNIPVVYTESQVGVVEKSLVRAMQVKLKKVRRKRKLCIQCNEVWFLIGVCVYPDRQNPVVCSKPCRRAYKKAREDEPTETGTEGSKESSATA